MIFILLKSVGCNDREKQRFPCVGRFTENVHLVLQLLCIGFVNGEWAFCIFDFTDVDCLVFSVNEKVNLRSLSDVLGRMPCTDSCLDA